MPPISGAMILFVGLFCAMQISANPASDDIIELPHFEPGAYDTEPSTKTGDLVAAWTPAMRMNPEELGNYLEGDMRLPPPSMTRSGLISTTYRWPNAVVPVAFKNFTVPEILDKLIDVFKEISNKTCIRFMLRTNETDYIRFTKEPTGCWSFIGRIGGRQDVNLQPPGCFGGTAIHEVLHALGLVHEHSSPERDNYIMLNSNNMQPGTLINFAKYTTAQVSAFNVPYDYGSIMHWGPYAFSKNNQPTIIPIQCNANSINMGQRVRLSAGDVATIKAMYNCP